MRLTADSTQLVPCDSTEGSCCLAADIFIYRKLASRDRYGGSHFCFFFVHKI